MVAGCRRADWSGRCCVSSRPGVAIPCGRVVRAGGSRIIASRSYGRNFSPHPLNPKSTPARGPSPAVTIKGPLSRIHESSIGSPSTSTASPHASCTSAPAPGAATINTGSNTEIARARAAYSRFASHNASPRSSRRVGHATSVNSCRAHSAAIAIPYCGGHGELITADSSMPARPNSRTTRRKHDRCRRFAKQTRGQPSTPDTPPSSSLPVRRLVARATTRIRSISGVSTLTPPRARQLDNPDAQTR